MAAVRKTFASSFRAARSGRGNPRSQLAVLAVWLLASLSALAPPVLALAQPLESRQRTPGRATFQTYCATCHGPAGRGDGPLAPELRRKPPDLAELARRNGGLFPSDLVYRTIDGRQPVRGHGGPDMPVWGDAFLRSRYCGDANALKETIDALVKFIESIQLRDAHEEA